jgi:ABC-type glycerol-3-phosphate transport system substrate-binding protein
MKLRGRRTPLILAALVLTTAAVVATARTGAARTTAPITLEVWDWGSPPPTAVQTVVDRYMKSHPNVKIKMVHQPFNSVFTQLRTAIAVRKGPDVFRSYASPFIFDFYRGLLPLTDLVRPADRKNLIGWEYLSAGPGGKGTPYALPWLAQSSMFYYNKALFKQAGLNPDKPPTTWAELLADCAALKKAGIVPIASGWKDGYYAEWWLDVTAAQYQTPSELANYAKTNWRSPAFAKAWNLLIDLRKSGYTTPNDEAIPLFPDTVDSFGAGKAAIFLGLSASAINYSAFAKTAVGPDLGAFVAPLVPNSKWKSQKYDFFPSASWAITKWTKHPKEAYDFISYLANAKSQETLFRLAGSIPNNKLSKPTTPDKVGQQILGWSKKYPTYTGQVDLIRSSVETVMDRVVPQVITGQISVADGMKTVQEAQEKASPIPNK